jgi:hypothetical protein
MSRLRVLICRVDDEAQPDKMTELHRFDLPSFDPKKMKSETSLDDLERSTLQSGQLIMRRLLEHQWEEVDDLLVESHERAFPPRDGDS